MTPKEARKFNKQIKVFKIQGVIISMPSNRLKRLYEKQEAKINWLEERYIQANETIKKLQNKFNTLKNDVARYFELQTLDRVATHKETEEVLNLFAKLRKAGKEDE